MGFFQAIFGKKAKSIDGFFNSAGKTVKTGFTKVTHFVDKKILQPIKHTIIEPVYNKIVRPVAQKGFTFVNHSLDRLDRIGEAGTRGLENAGNILSSKPFIYGGLALAGLIALKR